MVRFAIITTLLVGLASSVACIRQSATEFDGEVDASSYHQNVWKQNEHQVAFANSEDNQASFPFPHKPKALKKTIFEFLRDEKRFSHLFKLVNISEEVTKLLNDSSANVTFFAVPNRKRPPHHKKSVDFQELEYGFPGDQYALLSDLSDAWDIVTEDNAPDRKKIIKKIITAVLKYHILPKGYTSLALRENNTYATELKGPFGLLYGEPERIRVAKVPLPPFHLTINLYAKVLGPELFTDNGIIHFINYPLIPPPPIFAELFLSQKHFSTLTSALQRVGSSELVDFHSFSRKGSPSATIFAPTNDAFKKLPPKLQLFLFSPFGTRVLRKVLAYHTIPNITFYSDWVLNGTSVRSIEEFAVNPDDYSDYELDEDAYDTDEFVQYHTCFRGPEDISHEEFPEIGRPQIPKGPHPPPPPPPPRGPPPAHPPAHPPPSPPPPPGAPNRRFPRPRKPDFAFKLDLPTALTNHTLEIVVLKYIIHSPIPGHHKPVDHATHILVNGQVVPFIDFVGGNGAFHVTPHLLHPKGKGKRKHRRGRKTEEEEEVDWEDWEDWLYEWSKGN